MDKLLVDNNIVIDLLSKQAKFFQEAQDLFTLSDDNKVKLYVSSLTFANSHYILSKTQKADKARRILIKFKVLVNVVPFNDKVLDLALVSEFKDFEDAIQYHTALENDLDIIITRNKKDFKNSVLPVMTAKEYLISIAQ